METLEKKDGTGNSAASINFVKVFLQNTFLTLFPIMWVDMTQEILMIFHNSK